MLLLPQLPRHPQFAKIRSTERFIVGAWEAAQGMLSLTLQKQSSNL
jgi:hypothetical protein